MGPKFMASMGINFGPALCKKTYRWEFQIKGIIEETQGTETAINALPPSKASRPKISFKTMEAKHLNEDIFFPGKPDWKPISVTVYDVKTSGMHPIMKWINQLYDPSKGNWYASTNGFIKEANLTMLDSCGNPVEKWVYENAWIEEADFGELDYSTVAVATCDITLRYARAYIST